MKDMVKQAKANGKKFTCDGCHKDLDNYELTKNATDEYKKLEAASKVSSRRADARRTRHEDSHRVLRHPSCVKRRRFADAHRPAPRQAP